MMINKIPAEKRLEKVYIYQSEELSLKRSFITMSLFARRMLRLVLAIFRMPSGYSTMILSTNA